MTESIRLKPVEAILDGYLRSFPVAHALFRGSELKMLAGRELARPVLDLGCGTGQFATLVAESAVDAGVDVCKKRLAEARRQSCYLDLRRADARALPFADGSFETIVSLSALEHMPDPERVIAEAARVLRPGGTFVGTVVLRDLHEHLLAPNLLRRVGLGWLANWYRRGQDRVFQHRTLLGQDDWERMLRGRGFAITESRRLVGPRVTRVWDALLWTAWPFHFLGRGGCGQGGPPGWLRDRVLDLVREDAASEGTEGSVLYFSARKPAALLRTFSQKPLRGRRFFVGASVRKGYDRRRARVVNGYCSM